MNRMTKLIALLLMAALTLSAVGCSLVSIDEEKAAEEARQELLKPIATVNGVEIPRGDYVSMVEYYIQMYSYFGMDLYSDTETLEALKQDVLDSLIEQEVLWQKAQELGLDQLSAEEQATVDADYEEQISSYRDGYYGQAEDEAEDDPNVDVEARVDELFAKALENEGTSLEELKQDVLVNYVVGTKLPEYLNKDVSVSDEEIRTWYESSLVDQKAELAEDTAAYETFLEEGLVLSVPEGYSFCKHILIKFAEDEEVSAEITALEETNTQLASEIQQLIEEDKDANEGEIDLKNDQLKANKVQISLLEEQLKAPVREKALEVLEKVRAGEDFDQLMSEYGEDPGMKAEPAMSRGYATGPNTSFEEAFKEAAQIGRAHV